MDYATQFLNDAMKMLSVLIAFFVIKSTAQIAGIIINAHKECVVVNWGAPKSNAQMTKKQMTFVRRMG